MPALHLPILSSPFVPWSTKYFLTSLKTVTNSISQNVCHFWAAVLHVLSHSWKLLLGNPWRSLLADTMQEQVQLEGRKIVSVTKILQGRSNKLLIYFYCATTSHAIWDLQSAKWSTMKGQTYWTSLIASKQLQFFYFKVFYFILL